MKELSVISVVTVIHKSGGEVHGPLSELLEDNKGACNANIEQQKEIIIHLETK